MAKELDAHVEDFRTRPLDQGPYTFLAADALTMKVREGGRVVNTHVLVATGVNADGHRTVDLPDVPPETRRHGRDHWHLERPGRHHHLSSHEGALGGGQHEGTVTQTKPPHARVEHHRQGEVRGVQGQVVRDLVLGGVGARGSRERQPRQGAVLSGGEQGEGVPSSAPDFADLGASLEDEDP